MSKITKPNIDELIGKQIIAEHEKHRHGGGGEEQDYQISYYVIDLRVHIFQKRLMVFRN